MAFNIVEEDSVFQLVLRFTQSVCRGFQQLAVNTRCTNIKQMQASATILLLEKTHAQEARHNIFLSWFQYGPTEEPLSNGCRIISIM